jgi:tRNA(Ile)-lysidine synthase
VTAPPAETAAVRRAVRRSLDGLPPPVAAAVSGGADSLALAAALAFERPGSYALVVDHGLQPGSAQVAARAAGQCGALGLQARVLPVAAQRARGGPEAAARAARYAALDDAVRDLELTAVLLGHTLEDQAETVLLGLTRGAGARSLAGMAAERGQYRRPLLGLPRAVVRRACALAGLEPWDDPHNASTDFARVRVRSRVLPVLEAELGPGVTAALARTAALLREDADALDLLTPQVPHPPDVVELAALPGALRGRALKRWAESGCTGAVTSSHVQALRALVEDWHGQGPVGLPGGVRAERRDGRLHFLP